MRLPDCLYNVPVTGVENVVVRCGVVRIFSIIHSKHDGHHGGFVGENIALKTYVDGTTPAAGDAIAAPTGMNESRIQIGIARDGV